MSRTMTISSWLGLERDREVLGRVLVEPDEDLGVHAGDALGRVEQAVAVGVLADRLEDLAHRLLDARRGPSACRWAGRSRGHGRLRCRWASARARRRAATSAAWPGPARAPARPALGDGPATCSATTAPAARRPARARSAPGSSVGSGSGSVDAGALVERAEDLGQVGVLERLLLDERRRRARRAWRGGSTRIARARSWAVSMSAADLAVDDAGDLGRVVGLVAVVVAEEHLALDLAELLRAEAGRSCRTA